MIYQYQIQMWLPSWDSWSVWFCSATTAIAALVQSAHVYIVLGPYNSSPLKDNRCQAQNQCLNQRP